MASSDNRVRLLLINAPHTLTLTSSSNPIPGITGIDPTTAVAEAVYVAQANFQWCNSKNVKDVIPESEYKMAQARAIVRPLLVSGNWLKCEPEKSYAISPRVKPVYCAIMLGNSTVLQKQFAVNEGHSRWTMTGTGVTEAALTNLVSNCRDLHPDTIRFVCKGDAFCQAVAAHHRSITSIDLSGCETVTDTGLGALMQHCPQLHPDQVLSNTKGSLFLEAVANHHRDITTINLTDCPKITDGVATAESKTGDAEPGSGLALLMERCDDLHPDKVFSKAKGDAFLVAVANFHSGITEIDLNECDGVTDEGLAILMKKCKDLHPDKILAMNTENECLKGDAFLQAIAEHRSDIKEIDLTACSGVTDTGLGKLMEKCGDLHPDKVVSDTNVKGDAFLASVSQHHKYLEEIDLAGCSAVSDSGLAELIQKCPELRPDRITSDKKGDEFLLQVAKKHHSDLASIDLASCKSVGDGGLAELIKSCHKLHPDHILSDVKGDEFLHAVGKHQPNITSIDVARCQAVTDAGLAKLVSRCSNLHPDSIKSTVKGDAFLEAVAQRFAKTLKSIDLTGCKNVSDAGLAKLIEKCRELHPDDVHCDAKGNTFLVAVASEHETIKNIDLLGCNAVTDAGLCVLMERCLQLHPDDVKSTVKGDAFLSAVAKYHTYITNIDLDTFVNQREERVTDAALARLIETCPKLDPGNVHSLAKGNAFLGAVARYRKGITQIDLCGCPNVTDLGLGHLLQNCPGLDPTQVLSEPVKGDTFLASVTSRAPDVTTIDLAAYQAVTDVGLAKLLKICAKLPVEKIGSHSKGPAFLRAVGTYRPDVTALDLNGCAAITDAGHVNICFDLELVSDCSAFLPPLFA